MFYIAINNDQKFIMDLNCIDIKISDVINAIVAVAGILTSILTIFIIKESRKMRKYYSTPEISIYLKFAEASPTLLFIYIENLGLGTAHNVEFQMISDFKYYQEYSDRLSDKGIFSRIIEHFYPKQKFKYLVDSLHDVDNDKLKEPIVISVSYIDDYGKNYKRDFNLYIELYVGEGMMTPGDTHIRVISYRLEQMQKDINTLTKNISTYINKN